MIFDLELYSFLIITILGIDYYFKYRKSFEIDSYVGVAYIFSILIFLLINIGIYTCHPFSKFQNFIIYFAFIYSFLPPSILYIYIKRNYAKEITDIKKGLINIAIYNVFYIIILTVYVNINFVDISNLINANLSFFPHDYILSLSLLPLLLLSFRIAFDTYFKNEEIIHKLFLVTIIITVFVILNFFTSFIMLGTVIYTTCGLLICLNKYDKSIYRDSLTGLYNKRKLNQYITSNIYSNKLRALYVIDMDKFKLINDTYGHTKGDLILRNVASIIKNSIKTSDFATRYGGDEFIVVAELYDKNELDKIPNKIVKNVEAYNKKNDIHISLSVGSSVWNNGITFEEIMEKADSKMYKNKLDNLLTNNEKND